MTTIGTLKRIDDNTAGPAPYPPTTTVDFGRSLPNNANMRVVANTNSATAITFQTIDDNDRVRFMPRPGNKRISYPYSGTIFDSTPRLTPTKPISSRSI